MGSSASIGIGAALIMGKFISGIECWMIYYVDLILTMTHMHIGAAQP